MENATNPLSSITDLSFLKVYASGNSMLMKQFVETFLSKTPVAIEELETSFRNRDFHSLSRIAHSLKPQLSYVGIAAGTPLIIEIEENAKSQPDPVLIESKISELKELLNRAYDELKETLTHP